MDGREDTGSRARVRNGWRLTALVLLAATVGVVGVLVAAGPPDQEAEASAVLRTRVHAPETALVLRSPHVLRAIGRSTGASVAELRDDLSITEADGFRLGLRYRPGASASGRPVVVESLRRVGSELLDDALTRADRALVAAQRGDGDVEAAERAAQDARDARDAAFDIRVETAVVDAGPWTAGIAAAAVLLLLTVTACVLAARRPPSRRARLEDVPTSGARQGRSTPPVVALKGSSAAPLSLDELERRLAELTRRAPDVAREPEPYASAAKTTRFST